MRRRQGVGVFIAFDEGKIGWPGEVDRGDVRNEVRKSCSVAGFGARQQNNFGDCQTCGAFKKASFPHVSILDPEMTREKSGHPAGDRRRKITLTHPVFVTNSFRQERHSTIHILLQNPSHHDANSPARSRFHPGFCHERTMTQSFMGEMLQKGKGKGRRCHNRIVILLGTGGDGGHCRSIHLAAGPACPPASATVSPGNDIHPIRTPALSGAFLFPEISTARFNLKGQSSPVTVRAHRIKHTCLHGSQAQLIKTGRRLKPLSKPRVGCPSATSAARL
jgi:hypothetical protein